MLSIIVFLPLVAAIACAVVPASKPTWPRWVALAASLVNLVLATVVTAGFVPGGGMQYVERIPWVPQAGIEYHMGVDGLSLPMLFLSCLLTVLAVLVSWNTEKKPRFWFSMLMLLGVGMNGVFLALDFILFYVFWELVLVPMYFLIGQWGGPRREYAALKFFLYTLLGSVFMLLGIIVLYLSGPTGTAAYLQHGRADRTGRLGALCHCAMVGLRGVLPRLRGEGADVAASHVAA